ncbi:MAG: hypothetical protein MZW92_24940 [Comamonadaceae bacterium]|nr:hypothetical protein [Comamonadaceae bacterium]
MEKGLSWLANGLWYAIQPLYRIAPNPSITPAWSDKPLLKSLREDRSRRSAVPRETDFALPDVHPRGAPGDRRRQEATSRSCSPSKVGRDQGADHRARRQDPDGEGLPDRTATSRT